MVQPDVVAAQPFQQRDRGPQAQGRMPGDGGRGAPGASTSMGAVQYSPNRVSGERAPVGSVGTGASRSAIDRSSRASGSPRDGRTPWVTSTAEVVDRPTVRVGIEGFVGQRDVAARERGVIPPAAHASA
jgi:hypothetical protein